VGLAVLAGVLDQGGPEHCLSGRAQCPLWVP
jgi:hypothetical protein